MKSEQDPDEQFNVDLDPLKTLDFAVFKHVDSELMNPAESKESMEMLIQADACEPDEDKKLPPLDVIIYKELVPVAWSWGRLLPWMSSLVLFEDYFNYLEEYFLQNFANYSLSLNLETAAKACIVAESDLATTMERLAGLDTGVSDLHDLSTKIRDQAGQITDSVPGQSFVEAACFLCIAEEAMLMSKLADCMYEADESMAGLWRWKFQFGHKVRKAALHILTTYKGPYSHRVSASLLGMQKEATIAYELLNAPSVNIEDKMHISEQIRTSLLDLFNIILAFFPRDSAVNYYPINRAYPAITNEHRGLHLLEPSKQIRSADGSFPGNSPLIPISDAPATPLSCSASSLSDEGSVKDTKTKRKTKSIVGTQDSGAPSMPSSEPRKDVEIPDLFSSQITIDVDPMYEMRSADVVYPTKSSATTIPLSRSASAEEFGKDINTRKRRRSMEETKGSETPIKQSSEAWTTDVGMLDQFGSQITSDSVAAPDKFSGSLFSTRIMDSINLFGDGSDEDSTKKSNRTCDIQGSGS